MLTYSEILSEAQEQVQDADATTAILLSRAINIGQHRFGAVLNREWRTAEFIFSTEADKQFYPIPEDAIRPKSLVITVGNVDYPLKIIEDEDTWNELNRYRTSEVADIPSHWYVKGRDQVGIFPTPSSAVTNGATLRYEKRMQDMSVVDYITNDIDLTNGDATVTGNTTVFTAAMVGRTLLVEDSTSHNRTGYKIETFTSTTELELENLWAGQSGTGLSYIIGEVPDIPSEFHEALVDYACYRYYKRRRDIGLSRDMKSAYREALDLCKETYGSKTSSNYIRQTRVRGGYIHSRRDYTIQ